ncbi:hypothetical protein BGW41_001995 [Actinomortierella wolfii]|nr:hypothetical protein BGW41_001995 [Actinomortierella wolfii]
MLLVKSLALLCSAAVVLAQSTKAVSSGATFSCEIPHTKDPIQIFKNPENHLTALASILVYSAEVTSFKPASQPPETLATSLHDFIATASTNPSLFMTQYKKGNISLDGSLTQLEKAVNNGASVGFPAGRAIRDIFPGYIPDPTLDEWTLLLIGGQKVARTNYIYLYLITLGLKVEIDENHRTHIPKQAAVLSVITLYVNTSSMIANAERYAQMIPIVEVRDTVDFFTSPKMIPSDENDSWSFTCHKDASIFDRLSKQRILAW